MSVTFPQAQQCHLSVAGRPLGFYWISTTNKKTEYRPNIDHTALYRPNIDRKSSLKSAHLQYLLLSPEIYIFWENEAFREIWGISEDCFNWGHLGKHCIWTTWILMEYRPFWCNIDHKFKNIDHLSKMVDYRPMVDNIDPLASLQLRISANLFVDFSYLWESEESEIHPNFWQPLPRGSCKKIHTNILSY